jgi:dihydrofolate reductase
MEEFWPTASENAELHDFEREYGEIFNRTPKYVCSRTLTSQDQVRGDATLIHDDVPGAVRKLKAEADKDLFVCGADIATAMLREGLLDELRVWVVPVWLGEGKKLFKDFDERLDLRQLSERRLESGTVLNHYAIA